MFNRRFLVFIVLWALSLGALWWNWSNSGGEALFAWPSGVSAARYTQNLNGDWTGFSSLRQAWTTESERSQGKNNQSFLTKGSSIDLPSSGRFSVATKRFQIPGEWSSRTMVLTFNGVQGHVNVYLNGITSSQKIGEFEGSGGADELAILPKAFRYGEDNILLVELTGSSEQRATFLGSMWPRSGFIKGDIRLDAVAETTLMLPEISVEWQDTTAQVTVSTNVLHRGFAQKGPWTVYGVISDGSAGLAEQTVTVPAEESSDRQPVTLTFALPDARRWTMEDPYLYQLHLTVTNSKGDLDDLSLPLGLRTMSLEAGKLKLNNQVIKINGDALTPQEEYRLRSSGELEAFLLSERQKGKNLIYFIGQVPDEIWLQTADKIGIGLWAELPAELIPSPRLPQGDIFQTMISEKNLHPSLWAWTLGKGLAQDTAALTYLQQAERSAQPNPAFALTLSPDRNTGLAKEQWITMERTRIQGVWGEVTLEEAAAKSISWPKESVAAEVWAVLMIFLAWMNLSSSSWRYKEIGSIKPKRRLRNAWLWSGLLFLARMGMLSGLMTSGLFRIPIHANPWFSHLWPGIELLQGQSPWLLWAMFFGLLIFLKMLQIGVVVPNLPDNPHEIGLINWLERRYRWAVFIAVAWALLPWGIPFYVPVLGYILLVVLFLPIRIHDIHRIKGRYRPFLWVPGILFIALLVWACFYYADWLYLWNMLQPMTESIIHSIRTLW